VARVSVTEETWSSATSLRDFLPYTCGSKLDEFGRPFHSPTLDRKCRLIALAALRSLWKHLSDSRCREAIELTEQFADDLDITKLRRAVVLAYAAWDESNVPDTDGFVEWSWDGSISEVVCRAVHEDDFDPDGPSQFIRLSWASILDEIQTFHIHRREDAQAFHLRLFHDIFGNPFRPVSVERAWLTSTVVKLAEGMYESRDFGAMPILADALQDAGCDHADILDHCRGDGPHTRGCWVVDLLLGKT